MSIQNYTQTRDDYPKTMDEFLEQGWDARIKSRFMSWKFRDLINNPDDMLQDILTQMLATKYLDRYDPQKRVFEVYIFEFVSNFLKKRYQRENTRHGKYITSAASLVASSGDDENYGRTGEVYMDNLNLYEEDIEDNIAVKVAKENLLRYLEKAFTANSSTTLSDGTVICRDPATLFRYIENDFSVKEVAELMGVSCQFIYTLRNKIRTSPEGLQLREALIDAIYG